MFSTFNHVYDETYDTIIYYTDAITSRNPDFNVDGVMIWTDSSNNKIIQITIFNYAQRMLQEDRPSTKVESLLKEIPLEESFHCTECQITY